MTTYILTTLFQDDLGGGLFDVRSVPLVLTMPDTVKSFTYTDEGGTPILPMVLDLFDAAYSVTLGGVPYARALETPKNTHVLRYDQAATAGYIAQFTDLPEGFGGPEEPYRLLLSGDALAVSTGGFGAKVAPLAVHRAAADSGFAPGDAIVLADIPGVSITEDDRIVGGKGGNEFAGGKGDDVLLGKRGADDLDGGRGNDRLDGGDGGDVLSGGAGADRLQARRGADTLNGGAGDDRLEGGKGADSFVFGAAIKSGKTKDKSAFGADVVLDFKGAEMGGDDVIRFLNQVDGLARFRQFKAALVEESGDVIYDRRGDEKNTITFRDMEISDFGRSDVEFAMEVIA